MIVKRVAGRAESLCWRLGASFTVLVLLVTALLTGTAVRTAATVSLNAQKDSAKSSVIGITTAFADSLLHTNQNPAQLAEQLGLSAGGRVIWLGPDGIVRVDGGGNSGLNGTLLSLHEEMLNAHEPKAQIYNTGNDWVVYAISPLKADKLSEGYILLIRDLKAIRQELSELKKRLWITGAILASAFTLLGSLLAKSISKPIQLLTRAVQGMQAGKLKQSVPIEGSSEITSLSNAFNNMAAQVAELDEQRSAFVANAAHELRTPLAALKAMVEGMEYENGLTAGFIRQIDRLSHLVNSLLTLTRLDNSKLELNMGTLPVKGLLDEALWTMKPLLLKRKLVLNIEEETWIYGDPDWLHQALVNVLDNAIRYTPNDKEIYLDVKNIDDFVHIIIEDTGKGVEPDMLPYLGDRFFRISASRDRKSGGSGLGLSIVSEIVSLHNGFVTFDSPPDRGLKVDIALPKAHPENLTIS
ncbi:MAG TPA: HAMP domain-containing histidine kinase [Thermoanaerobacterales bacterium]|nr:HAMP domain-containing histidine kinase [Thermoanaerobacterales bacterium]